MLKKPEWLKIRYIEDPNMQVVERVLEKLNLNTVCREAGCPNSMECFSRKTATFMILGTKCTRSCRFCGVNAGTPSPPDRNEPANIAAAIAELGLRYAVVTSVTRDDLPDGGAGFFAEVVAQIQKTTPNVGIEVLIPDFGGNIDALRVVSDYAPTVIAHNMETVASLYTAVRPEAIYRRSLDLLDNIKRLNPGIRSKSGIMLGLGETRDEVVELLGDLRDVGCEFLTIGQYLAPSKGHYPVREYISPDVFEEYAQIARDKGFEFVASSPFVRSSYRAEEAVMIIPEQIKLEELQMSELTSMLNIGKELERKLKIAGIDSADELREIGSRGAFVKLKLRDPYVCLVHLYALEGAVSGIQYNQLPEDVKQSLKSFSDNLK